MNYDRGGFINDTRESARAEAIIREVDNIAFELDMNNYSRANVQFFDWFGYNPEFRKHENLAYAVSSIRDALNGTDISGPELYAVLDLGRSLSDDMDPEYSLFMLQERLDQFQSLDDNDRALAMDVLGRGQHFDAIALLACTNGEEQKAIRNDLKHMIPRKRPSVRKTDGSRK